MWRQFLSSSHFCICVTLFCLFYMFLYKTLSLKQASQALVSGTDMFFFFVFFLKDRSNWIVNKFVRISVFLHFIFYYQNVKDTKISSISQMGSYGHYKLQIVTRKATVRWKRTVCIFSIWLIGLDTVLWVQSCVRLLFHSWIILRCSELCKTSVWDLSEPSYISKHETDCATNCCQDVMSNPPRFYTRQ